MDSDRACTVVESVDREASGCSVRPRACFVAIRWEGGVHCPGRVLRMSNVARPKNWFLTHVAFVTGHATSEQAAPFFSLEQH